MYEQFLATVGEDEAETLVGVEPLHFAALLTVAAQGQFGRYQFAQWQQWQQVDQHRQPQPPLIREHHAAMAGHQAGQVEKHRHMQRQALTTAKQADQVDHGRQQQAQAGLLTVNVGNFHHGEILVEGDQCHFRSEQQPGAGNGQ